MFFLNRVHASRLSKPWRIAAAGIGCLFLNFLGVVLIFLVVKPSAGVQYPNSPGSGMGAVAVQQAGPRPIQHGSPNLEIRITGQNYLGGYLQVEGMLTNSGTAPAFGPLIDIRVFGDPVYKNLLIETTIMPDGMTLEDMNPGVQATFKTVVYVPGEPDAVYTKFGIK